MLSCCDNCGKEGVEWHSRETDIGYHHWAEAPDGWICVQLPYLWVHKGKICVSFSEVANDEKREMFFCSAGCMHKKLAELYAKINQ